MKSKSLILLVLCGCLFLNNCSPKEKSPDERLVDFVVKDLRQRVKSPSSFVMDSTRIPFRILSDQYKYEDGEEKTVEVYYQSKNAFGVLLQGFAIYDVFTDTNGNFLVVNVESYGSAAEYDKKCLNEIIEKYHSK